MDSNCAGGIAAVTKHMISFIMSRSSVVRRSRSCFSALKTATAANRANCSNRSMSAWEKAAGRCENTSMAPTVSPFTCMGTPHMDIMSARARTGGALCMESSSMIAASPAV